MEALYETSQVWRKGSSIGNLSRPAFLAACRGTERDVLRRKPLSRVCDLLRWGDVSARVTLCANRIAECHGIGNCFLLGQHLDRIVLVKKVCLLVGLLYLCVKRKFKSDCPELPDIGGLGLARLVKVLADEVSGSLGVGKTAH